MTEKTLAREIINSRVRLYHPETQVTSHGWAYDIALPRVYIASETDLVASGNFILSVNVEFGEINLAGRLSGIDASEEHQRKVPVRLEAGGSVRQVNSHCFCFEIGPDYQKRSTNVMARKAIRLTSIVLKRGTEFISVALHDVAKHGAGIISPKPLQRGESVTLMFDCEGAEFELEAEVMFCRRHTTESPQYFVGLKLCGVDRLTRARWNRMFAMAFEVPARSAIVNTSELELVAVEEAAKADAKLVPLPAVVSNGLVAQATSILQRLRRVSQVERRLILRETKGQDKFGNEALEDSMMDLENKLHRMRAYESDLEASLFRILQELRRDEEALERQKKAA